MKAAAEPVPVSPAAMVSRARSKPLLPVRGVMSLIDQNEDQVLRLIEDGQLAWAFDMSLDTKRGHSKELRILPAAVLEYMRGRTCSLEWPAVLSLLLPPDEPIILGTEITRVINCCSTHIYALARRKLITPCSSWRRGRGGSARFVAKSFVDFLKSRRFP
jgi:hypothetical protein